MGTKTKMIKEKTLEVALVQHLKNDGLAVYSQVPFSCKRIDVLYYSQEEREVTAIEVKISDWNDAFKQAYLNRMVSHKSYVAIYEEFANRVEKNIEKFKKYGVGVFLISKKGQLQEILGARTNEMPNKYFLCDFYQMYNIAV
jgi:hypothetical protein